MFWCIGVVLMCVVLHAVHKDLLGNPRKECPIFIDYTVQAKANSLYNTPNVWAVYIFNLVLKWVGRQGGVKGNNEVVCQNYYAVNRTIIM